MNDVKKPYEKPKINAVQLEAEHLMCSCYRCTSFRWWWDNNGNDYHED